MLIIMIELKPFASAPTAMCHPIMYHGLAAAHIGRSIMMMRLFIMNRGLDAARLGTSAQMQAYAWS